MSTITPPETSVDDFEREMSLEDFEKAVDQVCNHATETFAMISSGATGPVPTITFDGLPDEVAQILAEDMGDVATDPQLKASGLLPTIVGIALNSHKTRTVNQLEREKRESESATTAHVKRIKQGGNIDKAQQDFEEAIDKTANRNIADYTKREMELAGQLKKAGAAHPKARPAILLMYSKLSGFFVRLWDSLKRAFTTLVRNVKKLMEGAVKFIADKLGGAAKAVGKFIGGLF